MYTRLSSTTLFGFRVGTLILLGFVGLVGLLGLYLDLANNGLVDELLWNLTGETEPAAQVLGGLQYIANYTRQMPDVAADSQVEHIPDSPFGINAFLEQEAESTRREESMQLIANAGFTWLRQQFPWEDIEIDAKGDFVDRRSDRNLDGQIDEDDFVSSWDKYDEIVGLSEQYNVELIGRIGGPTPRWALADGIELAYTPPENLQDFIDYASLVATRYKGRIHYYQIWNEPNLYPEWGNQNIDPAGYTDLLCHAYDALKAIDPDIVIITGAIGPTIDLSGRNAYDVLFLQKLYDNGAGRCFDILAAQGYGLFSGPTDRRMRPYTVNYARSQWLRDVMVANGDEHKPIWISEIAWNPVPDNPAIQARELYGVVTPEQAAEYAPLAYDRAIREWPWVGVVNYWFLKLPNPDLSNQSWYYFRLVDPDWQPTPTYYSLQAYIQSKQWQQPEKTWLERARSLVPQVLVLGWALLFSTYVLGDALLKRFSSNED